MNEGDTAFGTAVSKGGPPRAITRTGPGSAATNAPAMALAMGGQLGVVTV